MCFIAAIPQAGFLLIADLTGYTAYLSQSEIEHAPAITADLLTTVVGRLAPPLRLAKFEGDAAFFFTDHGSWHAQHLLEAIEDSYLAFRRRLRSIDQATSCGCNSCVLAPRLDLKLFVYHGSYVGTRIGDRDELAGRDVIIVHRLLKGTVAAAASGVGFALFTSAAVEALGLNPAMLGLTEGEETIEHVGTIRTFKLDLEARWHAELGIRRIDSASNATIFDILTMIDAEPLIVWEHLTSSSLRPLWDHPSALSSTGEGDGRALDACVTERLATLEEVVDWQPPEHIGWRFTIPSIGCVLRLPISFPSKAVRVFGSAGRNRNRAPLTWQNPLVSASIAKKRSGGLPKW